MENWVLKRGRLSPAQVGLVSGDHSWTFKELMEDSLQLAARIDGRSPGLKRVAAIGTNSVAFYLLLLAFFHLEAEVVLLNNRLSPSELAEQIDLSQVDVVIVEAGYEGKVMASQKPTWPLASLSQFSAETADFVPQSQLDSQQVATIMFTSGTTGVPKGVKQTYGNHLASALGSALNLGMLPEDKWLLTVPLYHISGYAMLNKGLIYGNTVYLVENFQPEVIGALVKSAQITHVSLVPTMLTALLGQPAFVEAQSLRCLLLGGAPLTEALLAQCHQRQLPVIQSFGMTETASQVLALRMADAQRKSGSSGQPLWPVEVKIGQGVEGVGEILIKAPNVSPGYINAEMAKTVDGFFETGDLGYLDEEGFLYVVGRQKELIISGGENVYPLAVENALQQIEGIREAAVVGEADDYWGERVVAYVVIETDRPLSLAAVAAKLRPQLANFKQPKAYYQVAELPRNALGKVQKKRLTQLALLAEYHG